MGIAFYDADEVENLLDYPGCIEAMRSAMIALSTGGREQPLRTIWPLGKGEMWGIMPGDLMALSAFGAKLVSVFHDPERPGCTRHQGVIVAFDGVTGAISCIADAEQVTKIRTACATAVATDALARKDARKLAVFGTGVQAEAHLIALPLVRKFDEIFVWGRSADRTNALAERMTTILGRPVYSSIDAEEAAREADVICTVTSSREPVILGDWVKSGTHLNLVGSSMLGPVEVDAALVERSRYVADYRPGVIAQGAELAVARDAGLVDDSHVVAEIGEVLAGRIAGRENDEQVTVYKSLGHVAQDLAAADYLRKAADR
jgi:ornithine cyclodeaminase